MDERWIFSEKHILSSDAIRQPYLDKQEPPSTIEITKKEIWIS